MEFEDEIRLAVAQIVASPWSPRTGLKVPEVDEVALSGNAVEIEGSVVFTDLAHSTTLVRHYVPKFVAQVIRTFLAVAVRSIRRYGGEVRSFDGDRVMAIFMGYNHAANAVRSALLINGSMQQVAIPLLKQSWHFDSNYDVAYASGVDTSTFHVVRAGIRNNNDLIFIGLGTNYAAKLAQLRIPRFPVFITSNVHIRLLNTNLLLTDAGAPVFSHVWQNVIDQRVYGTNCVLRS